VKFDAQAWSKRANEVLSGGAAGNYASAGEAVQFATSMLTTLYGPESPQIQSLRSGSDAISKKKDGNAYELCCLALGVISNAKKELDAGLVDNIRASIAGEVLGELIRLCREVLDEKTDEAKNVGAVLISAAFEDLMRRMGEQFAGVVGRPKLSDVVLTLQQASVLKGGQIAITQGCLKLRNDSLHADWNNVDRSQVESCLAFSESLLLKHFS